MCTFLFELSRTTCTHYLSAASQTRVTMATHKQLLPRSTEALWDINSCLATGSNKTWWGQQGSAVCLALGSIPRQTHIINASKCRDYTPRQTGQHSGGVICKMQIQNVHKVGTCISFKHMQELCSTGMSISIRVNRVATRAFSTNENS